jgi:hypothetical protein
VLKNIMPEIRKNAITEQQEEHMDILTFFYILLRLSGVRHPEQQGNKGRKKNERIKICHSVP